MPRIRLTREGNDFADNIANESISKQMRSVFQNSTVPSAAFDIWAETAADLIKKSLSG